MKRRGTREWSSILRPSYIRVCPCGKLSLHHIELLAGSLRARSDVGNGALPPVSQFAARIEAHMRTNPKLHGSYTETA